MRETVKTEEVTGVEEGEEITIDGIVYIIDDSSAGAINKFLWTSEDITEDITVSLLRKSDKGPVIFLFSVIKAALEEQEE